jgi:hypothetical protein
MEDSSSATQGWGGVSLEEWERRFAADCNELAAVLRLPEVEAEKEEGEWTFSHEKLGVQVFTRPRANSSANVVKGEGLIKGDVDAVVAVCASLDHRAKWDTFFEAGEVLHTLREGELGIVHFWTKSSMTVWPRDFVLLLGKKKLSEAQGGGYLLCGKSIENSYCPADESKYVRATAHLSGFHIRPSPDDSSVTKITYIFQVDGAGWLPSAVINLGNTYQPLGLIGIRKLVTGKPAHE